MTRPPFFLVFDVESVGLHGDAFAVGIVMLNATTGAFSHTQRAWCSADIVAQGTYADRVWVQENVPAFDQADRVVTPRELRDWFWRNWMYAKSLGALLAADVAWPVEANFLRACIADDPTVRMWDGPYPLIDIASVRMAKGLDPLGTEPREVTELPIHDPLADARQSARLLLEALNRV